MKRQISGNEKFVIINLELLEAKQRDNIFRALRVDPDYLQAKGESDFTQLSSDEPSSKV